MSTDGDSVTSYGRGNRQHGLFRPCGLLRQICVDQIGEGCVVIQYVRSGSCRSPIRPDEGKTRIGRSDISDETKSGCAHRSTLLLEARSDGLKGDDLFKRQSQAEHRVTQANVDSLTFWDIHAHPR